MGTVTQRDFMIGDRLFLFVHVAHRVEMDAGGDEGHHAEHDNGQGVDVIADGQPQLAELAEQIIVAGQRLSGRDFVFGSGQSCLQRRCCFVCGCQGQGWGRQLIWARIILRMLGPRHGGYRRARREAVRVD